MTPLWASQRTLHPSHPAKPWSPRSPSSAIGTTSSSRLLSLVALRPHLVWGLAAHGERPVSRGEPRAAKLRHCEEWKGWSCYGGAQSQRESLNSLSYSSSSWSCLASAKTTLSFHCSQGLDWVLSEGYVGYPYLLWFHSTQTLDIDPFWTVPFFLVTFQ